MSVDSVKTFWKENLIVPLLKSDKRLFGESENRFVWMSFWILQALFFILYARVINRFLTGYPHLFTTFAGKIKLCVN